MYATKKEEIMNRHEYDPLLRSWVYGGPGEPDFDHTADGWNFWCGDVARGLVGTMMGDEPKNTLPADFDDWTEEQREDHWQEIADKNLAPEMKEYLEIGMAARKAGIKAGVI